MEIEIAAGIKHCTSEGPNVWRQVISIWFEIGGMASGKFPDKEMLSDESYGSEEEAQIAFDNEGMKQVMRLTNLIDQMNGQPGNYAFPPPGTAIEWRPVTGTTGLTPIASSDKTDD
jgi:hypothetical protein